MKQACPSSSASTPRSWVLPTLLALVAVFAATFIAAEVDYKLYTPGTQVRRWHSDFDLQLDELGGDNMVDYAQDVGVKRVAPVIIVGVICFIGLLIWACCRLSCCGNKCVIRDASTTCKLVMAALLIGTLISGIALISVGLDADRQQSDAMDGFPVVIDSVIGIVEETAAFVDDLTVLADRLSNNADDLIDAADGSGIITEADVEDMRDAVTQIRSISGDIDDEIDQVDFSDLDDFSDDVGDYNDQRHTGMVAVLAVLLTLVLLEGGFALLNAFAGEGCKPKQNCLRFFTPIVGILSIIVLLLLWILAGALVGVMTASSDVCYDPNAQFTLLLTNDDGSDSDDLIQFFINCGADQTIPNPLKAEVNEIVTLLNNATTLAADLQQEVNNSSDCDTNANTMQICSDINDALVETRDILGDLQTTLGTNSIDANGNAQEGFLRLAGCYGVNERYNLALRTFCGDGAEALGKSTEVVLGFAVIYVFTQILIKLVTDTGMDYDDDSKLA